MDEFVHAYEEMVAEIERVVAQYPQEMREDLRTHAREVIDKRLKNMWEERQRRRALLS